MCLAGVGDYDGYVDALYGKKGRIVAFKLGGGDVPEQPRLAAAKSAGSPPDANRFGTPEQISHGEALYAKYCAVCHSAGRAPDLKRMNAQSHQDFMAIVRQGTRVPRGMGSFGDLLSRDDAEAIHAFVTDAAWRDFERRQSGSSADAAAQ